MTTQPSVHNKCVMFMGIIMLFELKTCCFLRNTPESLATKQIRNKGSLSAIYSPALYAKQPVILPTESLLVFTHRLLQWSTHVQAYRREWTCIHIHKLSVFCSLCYTVRHFFPCVSVATFSAHPHAYADSYPLSRRQHPHRFQGVKLIDTRYVLLCSCKKGLTGASADMWS